MELDTKRKNGFSLLEVIVVIAVLGLVAVFAVPNLSGWTSSRTAENDVAKIRGLIDPFEEKVTEVLRGFDGGKVFISRADEITFSTHLVTQSEE